MYVFVCKEHLSSFSVKCLKMSEKRVFTAVTVLITFVSKSVLLLLLLLVRNIFEDVLASDSDIGLYITIRESPGAISNIW